MQTRFGPTIKELARELGEDWPTIVKRIDQGQYRASLHGLKGNNHRILREIDPTSLPSELQTWWAEKMKNQIRIKNLEPKSLMQIIRWNLVEVLGGMILTKEEKTLIWREREKARLEKRARELREELERRVD